MIKILNNGIVEISINNYILQIAEAYSKQNFINTDNSFLKGKEAEKGNLVGSMGEVLFEFLFPQAKRENSVNYDFKMPSRDGNGNKKEITIDIKSKSISVDKINDNMDLSVYSYLIKKQKNDYYVFFYIKKDLTKAWLVGSISKQDFIQKAKLWKVGEIDTESANKFEFKKECYNIKVSELKKLGENFYERV